MKISFQSRKFAKAANSESQGDRLWGSTIAARVRQRISELKAANTLADMSTLPPARCHQLTENLDEIFAVDVSRKERLVFEVADNPIQRKPDGGIDLKRVTEVRLLRIEDYHGN
jgi:proteic killer suppression protein